MDGADRARDLLLAGGAGALALLLPALFHTFGAGAVFLPMHLPIVALGFLVAPRSSLWVALLVPGASSLATGMPPLLPTAPSMAAELSAACLAAWLFHRRLGWRLWLALPATLLAGLLVGAGATALLVAAGPLIGVEVPLGLSLLARATLALPGYGLQLVAIPLLLAAAGRAQCSEREARAAFFTGLAGRWDEISDPARTSQALDLLLEPWRGEIAGRVVADLGCGTGQSTAWLLSLPRPPARVLALDSTPEMLRRCRGRAPQAGLLQARAEALPLGPGAVDFILALGLYPHLADRAAFLASAARALVPGGRLVILHCAGRDTINRVHAAQGEPISRDLLPPAEEVAAGLPSAGFVVEAARETGESWLVAARKN